MGKTTLLRQIFEGADDVLWLNADEPDVRALFENPTSTLLAATIGSARTVIIDEAQRIADAGLKLKLITDGIRDVQLIATGSSSLESASRMSEPLTGRMWRYVLHPLSFGELVLHHGLLQEKRLLPQRLVYGSYPEVATTKGGEKELLSLLADSYLYRDILELDNVKKPSRIIKLLRAVAYQVGNQVSNTELGRLCELDNKTVDRYLSLLEQSFVLFSVGSYQNNLRSELKASRKWYFCDNGIRNAVIGSFAPIENRTDIGALWENYLMSERRKLNANDAAYAELYFWRTRQQQEIDCLDVCDGTLAAFEFKWSPQASARPPKTFMDAYPKSTFTVVNRDNYESFLKNR